jgi:predicted metal-dependent phosphotriesterase family hydrolase
VTIVRTVLGDIDPADLGVTHAHEHVAIDGGRPTRLLAGFAAELETAGIDAAIRRRLFVDNPARAFAFAEVDR